MRTLFRVYWYETYYAYMEEQKMGEWERASEKGRLQRYVESFQRLADVFRYLPSKKEELSEEDLQEIYEAARDNICSECGRRRDCWDWNLQKTARMIYDLLTEIADSGDDRAEEEEEGHSSRAEERFCRYCIKGMAFREELKNCFYRAKLNLMWSNRMLENRAAVAQQLQETANIIEEIACTVFDAGETDSALEKKVRYKLLLQRVWVKDLRIFQGNLGHSEIVLTASVAKGHCVTMRTLADVLSQACGYPVVPERDSRLTLGHEVSTMHFVEETNYYMLTGMAGKPGFGQAESGDNFAVLTGSHGQVILGISDGMGTGSRACRESQTVIELLEQFLGAGFAAETAVRMINSAMVLQRGMQQFSTLDICGVNLYTGQCEFLKIGAATTFIRRATGVETITSTSLPVGIFREVDFERARKRLEHGDMIVMVSDGVLDALPEDNSMELMKYLIAQTKTDNPSEFADLLLEQVVSMENGIPVDDMTVLAGSFWKK